MKNKINGRFMLIAAMAIVLTTLCTTIVYYQLFQKEVFEDLKNFCYVLEETGLFETKDVSMLERYTKDSSNLRITVIDREGNVLYDTYSDVDYSENHKNRPEIAQAYETGSGKSIRTSTTINKSNYYYAVLLENGGVLRVAKETRSIVNLFVRVLPVIVLIMVLLFFICMIIGHYLTKNFVKPIEQVASNLDNLEQVKTYKELMPFIHVIRNQHENILKSARMRQEFTANVSHELKTPLTSISGYSELIANGMVKEGDIERFATEIHRNAKRLISLINDIIKLSELDSSKEYDLVMEDVDLYELAKNCQIMLAPVAEKRNITIHLEGQTSIMRVDKELMEEVIYNLCDNAIRYNHEGGHVWITVSHGFSVRDDGIGISKEHQERIFERFYRVDKSRSKKTGGTGLGLAIVKHIVELHDGEIQVESEENAGTIISVIL
ncbi:MAG: ATP-binding protein [Lachnospiraceae bacterium]